MSRSSLSPLRSRLEAVTEHDCAAIFATSGGPPAAELITSAASRKNGGTVVEDLGYLVRKDAAGEGRARVVRFTKRGHAAYAKIADILREIERDWTAELGPKDFAQLKALLFRVWESPLTS